MQVMPHAAVVARRAVSAALVLGASSLFLPARLGAQATAGADSVSVAPGIRMSASLAGASRALLDSSDVRRAAALTFSELMQARAASVNVSMSGGRLVDGGQFLIRGPSTIATEGAPMLVVDGMRMAEQEDDPVSTSSRLDDIAIDDIATVEVLRGPSAAALYGAGASAGVIVVTTKRGTAGPLHAHVRAIAEGSRGAGSYADRYRRRPVGSTTNFSCTLSAQAAGYCVPGPLERWNPLTEGDVFHSGVGATAALDVAGGTRTSDARLSATVRRANGISRGDGLGSVATRLNVTQRLGDRIDVAGRVAYTNDQTSGSTVGEVIDGVSTYSVGPTPADSFARWADFKLSSPAIDGRLDHLTAGGELTARLARWLTLRGAATTDNVDEAAERIIKSPPFRSTDPNAIYLQPSVSDDQFIRRSLNNTRRSVRATGELAVPIPASLHGSAQLIVGVERERRYGYREASQGFGSSAGALITDTRVFTNPAQFVLGRVEIADRVAIGGGARREKDDSADPNWDIYPTADVAIRPTGRIAGGETRIRAAYGESAQRYALTSSMLPVDIVPGLYYGTLPPPRPLPERMKEVEGGIDVSWGRAGAVSATYYHRTVDDVAYGEAAPFGALAVRTLGLASRGVEIDARAAVVRRGDVAWDLRGIVATNSNQVTTDGVSATTNGASLVSGYPVGVVQRRRYSVVDANGNGVFDVGEVAYGSEMDRFGGSTPTLTLALHSELRLGRRFSLTGVVDRRSGAWTASGYSTTRCRLPELSCREFQDQSMTVAEQAKAWVDMYNTGSAAGASYDATFTRLREVSLRWALEPDVAGVARGTAIVLSGRNLATWTQFPGSDPEINSLGRSSVTRSDVTAVPLPRRVTLGVEIGY